MTYVIAIAGSPSHPSRSYSVLEYAQATLQAQDIQTDLLSVRELPPEALLHAQFEHPAIQAATAQIVKADGIIVATPVYKAAYTGVLKSFLDLLPQQAFVGKPILPIATGGTLAHLLILDYALNPVLSALGGRQTLGGVYIVDHQVQRQEDGRIQISEEVAERLQDSLQAFINAVKSAPLSASAYATAEL